MKRKNFQNLSISFWAVWTDYSFTRIGQLGHDFLFYLYLGKAPCLDQQVLAVSEDAANPTAAGRVGIRLLPAVSLYPM